MATSSTPLISYWHPDVTYDFTLRIGEKDYSTDLTRLEIRSAVTMPYQHIFLDVFMNPRDLLSESFFGQQEIKLIIRLKGKVPESLEEIEFKLMYIDTEADYSPVQRNSEQDQVERTVVRFKTVCVDSYQTMSTMVNEVQHNKTPYTIISDLFSKNTNITELIYDSQGRSKLTIDQLIIPPTTLYNVINYIDNTYGIFDGAMALHTTFDNKVKIQNLTKKVKTAQKYTLYLTATDGDESKVFSSTDGNMFYSKKAVSNSYKGNAVFSVEAPSLVYITKPKDQLFATIDIDLESFAKEYGILEPNNPQIYYNKDAIDYSKRIGYEKDQTGYDIDQTFINANLSQNIVDMATLVAEIDGNLPILNLMEVGEHVKVISHIDSQLKLGGAYILKGSDIQFVKATTWESFARMYLCRTNIAQQ